MINLRFYNCLLVILLLALLSACNNAITIVTDADENVVELSADFANNKNYIENEIRVQTLNIVTTTGYTIFSENFNQFLELVETSFRLQSENDFRLNIIEVDSNFNDNFEYAHTTWKSLLASNEVDLFVVGGHPLTMFAKEGYLKDIYELIDKDSDIRRDDFYANVLEQFEYNNTHLIALPTMFNIPLIGINSSLPLSIIERFNNFSSVTILDLLELYDDLVNNYKEFSHLDIINRISPLNFVSLELSNHVNLANNTLDFDIYSFTNFLDITRPLLSAPLGITYHPFHTQRIQQLSANTLVFDFKIESLTQAPVFFDSDEPYFVNYVPLVTCEESIVLYPNWAFPSPHNTTYSIAANGNVDLAWDFLKHLMYFHAFSDFSGSNGGINSFATSIRRNWYYERTSNIFNDLFNYKSRFRPLLDSYDYDTVADMLLFSSRGVEDNEQKAIVNAMTRHSSYINMPMKISEFIPYSLFNSSIEDFLQGNINAETAACQIYERLIFWMEQE